jgi:uncharacterized repeat protein (TIGR03803 family)
VLYDFRGVDGDGGGPMASLTFDSAGNLYSTTEYGGKFGGGCSTIGCGTVFELIPKTGGTWQESILHSFGAGSDGDFPVAAVVLDSEGNVWGTTIGGGLAGSGIIFKVTP